MKTVGRIFYDYNQSKRPSEVDATGLSIYHPTKLYTCTIKQNRQASNNHQAPKAFFGFLARFFGPQRNGLDGVRGAPACPSHCQCETKPADWGAGWPRIVSPHCQCGIKKLEQRSKGVPSSRHSRCGLR